MKFRSVHIFYKIILFYLYMFVFLGKFIFLNTMINGYYYITLISKQFHHFHQPYKCLQCFRRMQLPYHPYIFSNQKILALNWNRAHLKKVYHYQSRNRKLFPIKLLFQVQEIWIWIVLINSLLNWSWAEGNWVQILTFYLIKKY